MALQNDDHLTGSDLADDIFGLAGNDVIEGLDGDDVLRGDDGNDTIDGGLGRDYLRVQATGMWCF